MYDFIIFCLQVGAITAYLVMLIAFTMGMLHANFKGKGEGFGGANQETLNAIKALERKLDAALAAND